MAKDAQDQLIVEIAAKAKTSFSETDWKELAQRVGFRKRVNDHPRLLRSLRFGDEDYGGHVLDILNEMVAADSANFEIIRARVAGDQTAFFESQGRFADIRILGRGGYGEVYEEKDSLLGMTFARKDLKPSAFISEEVIGRFLREARLLFRLSHPNIVRVYDVGRFRDSAYIRMEYIEGQTLGQLGRIEPPQARHYVKQVLSALEHAHEKSIIHRDLKPSNVLIQGDLVKVIDFGLGAFVDASLDTDLTPTGKELGGGSFADPEMKENPGERDCRWDLYSVGALWYSMVTGRAPGGANMKENLGNIGSVPETDMLLMLKCMHSRGTRPQSAREILDKLEPLSGEAVVFDLSPPQLGMLDRDEILVIATFAKSFHYGLALTALELETESRDFGLRDRLSLGLAVSTLEARGYIVEGLVGSASGWFLTVEGKTWLASNTKLVRDVQPDKGKPVEF